MNQTVKLETCVGPGTGVVDGGGAPGTGVVSVEDARSVISI
jgi:hypothetical protein